MVGVGIAQDYRQIALDRQGKKQTNNNRSFFSDSRMLEMIMNLIRNFAPSAGVDEVMFVVNTVFLALNSQEACQKTCRRCHKDVHSSSQSLPIITIFVRLWFIIMS